MGQPVVTVASGGRPVVVSTNGFGIPVDEATNGRGIAVTQVTNFGMPVIYVTGGAPVITPTLTLTSPTTDNTPDFTLTGDLAVNDVVRFQYANNSSFTGATDITHTITAPEDAANSFSFSTGTLALGAWWFRARVERPVIGNSGWSNTVTETIVASYTGPGDKVAGALGWWGLAGYTAAYSTGSNPAIDITDQAGANALTVNIRSDGMLDTATVSAWVTAHSVSQIKITKLYNQAGGTIGNLTPFSGTSIYLILNASGLGAGKATIDLFTGSAFFVSAGSVTINQPFFVATAISADVSMAGNDQYFGDTALGVYSQYRTSSSSFAVSGGSGEVVRAATTVTFHAVQTMLLNTGSGTVYIDGTGTTGSGVGTTGIANILRVGAGFGSSWAGRFSELGVWGIAPTAQNNIDIDANIRLRWGF